MLALYGHPFSSYTWKALIALYANATPFAFRMVDADHPDNVSVVQTAGPLGKFPVLADGDRRIFEASSIVEHLQEHHRGSHQFIPDEPDAALAVRTWDRVFDNYVMTPVQVIVDEYIRNSEQPDMARVTAMNARLRRTYAWLEQWLAEYPADGRITLVECAAAPSLFYADWVEPIGSERPRLADWRGHLLALPPVARCVEEARPYRAFFPLGAPDRD